MFFNNWFGILIFNRWLWIIFFNHRWLRIILLIQILFFIYIYFTDSLRKTFILRNYLLVNLFILILWDDFLLVFFLNFIFNFDVLLLRVRSNIWFDDLFLVFVVNVLLLNRFLSILAAFLMNWFLNILAALLVYWFFIILAAFFLNIFFIITTLLL